MYSTFNYQLLIQTTENKIKKTASIEGTFPVPSQSAQHDEYGLWPNLGFIKNTTDIKNQTKHV